jgi:hypothetical protein
MKPVEQQVYQHCHSTRETPEVMQRPPKTAQKSGDVEKGTVRRDAFQAEPIVPPERRKIRLPVNSS